MKRQGQMYSRCLGLLYLSTLTAFHRFHNILAGLAVSNEGCWEAVSAGGLRWILRLRTSLFAPIMNQGLRNILDRIFTRRDSREEISRINRQHGNFARFADSIWSMRLMSTIRIGRPNGGLAVNLRRHSGKKTPIPTQRSPSSASGRLWVHSALPLARLTGSISDKLFRSTFHDTRRKFNRSKRVPCFGNRRTALVLPTYGNGVERRSFRFGSKAMLSEEGAFRLTK